MGFLTVKPETPIMFPCQVYKMDGTVASATPLEETIVTLQSGTGFQLLGWDLSGPNPDANPCNITLEVNSTVSSNIYTIDFSLRTVGPNVFKWRSARGTYFGETSSADSNVVTVKLSATDNDWTLVRCNIWFLTLPV